MNSRQYVRCSNRNCEAACGLVHGATSSDPGYLDLDDGAVWSEENGDIFCSLACCNEASLSYCADCGDEKVEKGGDRCTYCALAAEQGEAAAYAWYCSQHPEILRKPVAAVPRASHVGTHWKAM